MGNAQTQYPVDPDVIEESHRKLIEDILDEMDMSGDENDHEIRRHDHEDDTAEQFKTKKVQHVLTLYDNIETLGVGGTCSVRKMRERATGKFCAVKTMPRSQRNNEWMFRNEVEILTALDHPQIIKYHDHFVDERRHYIVTEYCSGLTLSHRLIDRVRDNDRFSEQEAAEYVRQILSAAAYIHSKQIVHRDFKCNNIVFTENGDLKVIDFGLSRRVDPSYLCYDFVGTLYCAAPESAYRRSGETLKKSDVWAIGVICFMLVTGRPPFEGQTQRETIEQIMNYRDALSFSDDIEISAQCEDFLHCLLCCDVDSRLSAGEALCHQWIVDDSVEYKTSLILPPTEPSADVWSAMMSYTVNGTPRGSLSLEHPKERRDFDFSILEDMNLDKFLDSFLNQELRAQSLQKEGMFIE